MVNRSELHRCERKLFVYDVKQRGWEQEPNGFEANVAHTLTHLVKDGYRKSFTDADIVEEALAPDSLMYAIRLGRWQSIYSKRILLSINSIDFVVDNKSQDFPGMPKAYVAHQAAADRVAEVMHEQGHASSREGEYFLEERYNNILLASQLLIYSANSQAEHFNFDLGEAFDHRLVALRERFNIPESPDQI